MRRGDRKRRIAVHHQLDDAVVGFEICERDRQNKVSCERYEGVPPKLDRNVHMDMLSQQKCRLYYFTS